MVMKLARDVVLDELIGLDAAAIQNISLTTGVGKHNLSKGVAVLSLNIATALPKAAGAISFKILLQKSLNSMKNDLDFVQKLKDIDNFLLTNPLDELGNPIQKVDLEDGLIESHHLYQVLNLVKQKI